MSQHNDVFAAVQIAIDGLRARVRELERVPPDGVAGLLRELLAADEDAREHHRVRYPLASAPKTGPYAPYYGSLEEKEDWHRCCARRDAAVAALIDYARRIELGTSASSPAEEEDDTTDFGDLDDDLGSATCAAA